VENKIWKISVIALTYSHQFRYYIFLSVHRQYRFTSSVIFWALDFITVDTNDVNAFHSIMPLWEIQESCSSRLLCVPISCGIACLSNILSFFGYHLCHFTSSVISVIFNYTTLKDKAIHVASNPLLYVYVSFTLACFPNIFSFLILLQIYCVNYSMTYLGKENCCVNFSKFLIIFFHLPQIWFYCFRNCEKTLQILSTIILQ